MPRGLLAAQAYALVGALLAVLAAFLIAQILSPSAYGEYGASVGVLTIAATFCVFGLGTTAPLEIRKSLDRGTPERARGFMRFAPIAILIGAGVAIAILVGSHALIHRSTAVRLESFAAVIAVLPLFALGKYLGAEAAAHGAGVSASFARNVLAPTIMIVGASIALTFGIDLSVVGAATLLALSQITLCVGIWIGIRRSKSPDLTEGPRSYTASAWLRTGVVFAVPTFWGVVLDKGGIVLLGWLHVDAVGAARYFAASTIAMVPFIVARASLTLFNPAIADMATRTTDHKTIAQIWWTRTGIPVIGIGVALAAAGPFILRLYGPAYEAAYPTLLVMLLLYCISGAFGIVSRTLQYLNRSKIVNYYLTGWAIAGLAMMALLGFRWSAFGVAVGQAIAFVGYQLMLLVYMRRHGDEISSPPTV